MSPTNLENENPAPPASPKAQLNDLIVQNVNLLAVNEQLRKEIAEYKSIHSMQMRALNSPPPNNPMSPQEVSNEELIKENQRLTAENLSIRRLYEAKVDLLTNSKVDKHEIESVSGINARIVEIMDLLDRSVSPTNSAKNSEHLKTKRSELESLIVRTPNFWKLVFLSNEHVKETFSTNDRKLLVLLNEVLVTTHQAEVTITMKFLENQFTESRQIVKTIVNGTVNNQQKITWSSSVIRDKDVFMTWLESEVDHVWLNELIIESLIPDAARLYVEMFSHANGGIRRCKGIFEVQSDSRE